MKVWQRRQQEDRGATLILVLIVISVIGMVTSLILQQGDTNVRSTVALRDQANDNYGADGATNAVLNALKTSGLKCGDPSHLQDTVTLGSTTTPFYVPKSTVEGSLNGYAKCTADVQNGLSTSTSTVTATTTVTPAPVTSSGQSLGGGDVTLPTYALLTTGSASGDFGIDISTSANNKVVCVENGSVWSNNELNASGERLAVRLAPSPTIPGSADCTSTTNPGTSTDPVTGSKLLVNAAGACTGTFVPTACKSNQQTIAPPAAPGLPTGTTAVNPTPTCDSTNNPSYAAFVPGVYTDVNILNTPCKKQGTPVAVAHEWFSPGWYYFDYGSTQWTWPSGWLIGGTPLDKSTNKPIANLSATTSTSLSKLANVAPSPGACDDPDPVKNPSGGVQGVSFVFGGSSQVTPDSTANPAAPAEICASSPTNSPPLAIYGLASDQTVSTTTGPKTIQAETMCTATGCGSNSLINTASNGHAQVYVHGYVYAPNTQMILTLQNSVGQVFNWGLIVRNFRLSINGSSPTQSVIHLPKPNTGIGTVVTTSTPPPYPTTSVSTSTSVSYTIRYINVWTCTVASLQSSGQTECSHTGAPDVQVKVRVPSDGSPLQILSWSHTR